MIVGRTSSPEEVGNTISIAMLTLVGQSRTDGSAKVNVSDSLPTGRHVGAILATIVTASAAPVNVVIHPRKPDGMPRTGTAAIARVDEDTWRVQPMSHHQRLPLLILLLRGAPAHVSEALAAL
jgi:hypothetical protein